MQISLNDFHWFGFTNQRADLTKEIECYNLNQPHKRKADFVRNSY